MPTMAADRKMHESVLTVSMDSPKKYHVITGKTKYETPNPINLTAHNDPHTDSYKIRVA